MDQRSYKLRKIVDDNTHAIDVWHLMIPKMWLRNFSTIQDKKKHAWFWIHNIVFVVPKVFLPFVLTTHCYFEKWFPKYQNMMCVGEGVVNSHNSELIIIQNIKVKIWNKMTPKRSYEYIKDLMPTIFSRIKI